MMYGGIINKDVSKWSRCGNYKHKLLFSENMSYCEKCYSKGFSNAFKSLLSSFPKTYLNSHPELIETKMYYSLIKNYNNG